MLCACLLILPALKVLKPFVLFLFRSFFCSFFFRRFCLAKGGGRKAVPCLEHSQCLSRWNRDQGWLSQILLGCLPRALNCGQWRRGEELRSQLKADLCLPSNGAENFGNLSPPAFRVRFVLISQFRCPGAELILKWLFSLFSASVPLLLYLPCSHHLWTIVFHFYHFYPRGVSTKN